MAERKERSTENSVPNKIIFLERRGNKEILKAKLKELITADLPINNN